MTTLNCPIMYPVQVKTKSNARLAAATAVMIVTATCGLSACGGRDEKKPVAQVVARVNGNEITNLQLNFVIQRIAPVRGEDVTDVRKRALEGLVEQELAVQQSLEAKLDRNPEVQEAMELARREILARAFLESRSASAEDPGQAKLKAYYVAHPELFSARKIYHIEQIALENDREPLSVVRAMLGKSASFAEIASALKSRGIRYDSEVSTKAAEQLPLEILPNLASRKEGSPLLIEAGDRVLVINVISTTLMPLAEAQAMPMIRQYLVARQRADAAQVAMKQLREQAKIEYVGSTIAEAQVGPGGPGAVVGALGGVSGTKQQVAN